MLSTNLGDPDTVLTARDHVVGLSEHRSRRRQRLQLARAIYSGDPVRLAVVTHLSELSEITGADRAAAVWVDEYGDPVAHTHVIVDLMSDRPRRSFPVEPLERAWEVGLPGVYETAGANRRAGDGASRFAVALGSDGARSWFLVCESVGPRARLSDEDRQRALFVSGECAGALLHQDLDPDEGRGPRLGASKPDGFVGFPVLKDCEGQEDRLDVSARVEQRFMVLRVARALVDEDAGAGDPHGWNERVRVLEDEVLQRVAEGGDSEDVWSTAFAGLRERDLARLARGLTVVGRRAEVEGHRHGAMELYRCAFDAAAAVMDAELAVDAARFQGRIQRRSARWDKAVGAYQVACEVARAAGLDAKNAQALGGLAAVRQEIGNLPLARSGYQEALELATRSGVRDVVAAIHHGLLALEHAAGNLVAALNHGWTAVGSYENTSDRVRSLAGLAGALVDFGDRSTAVDAWTIVSREAEDVYYRMYAFDALAYLAALRGDLAEFERNAAACDALGWEDGSRSAKAEILFYRGLSYQALGMLDAAERWLERAVRHADEFGLNRTLFRAEEALKQLVDAPKPREAVEVAGNTEPSAPREVREGLREMRRVAVGASV